MGRLRVLVIGSAVAVLAATGCEWGFETLDGDGGPGGRTTHQVGWTPKTALLYDSQPHVFFYDVTDEALRQGYWNGQFWAFEVLDGVGGSNGRTTRDVGRFASAVIYNGHPHVFYSDVGALDLRHGYYDGTTWVFETLDGHRNGPNGELLGNVGDNATSVLYNGRPHVFYRDNTNGDLRHAYFTGNAWVFETLDGNGGANGRTAHNVGFANTALLYNGRPHIFYSDNTSFDLRHGYWTGATWAFETLDGAGGANERTNESTGYDNAAVLYGGRPHVFYRTNSSDLRQAYFTGSLWRFETLDGNGGPNGRTTAATGFDNAAVVSGGRLRVFSHDLTNGDLRHAYFTGSAWGFETLDGMINGPNGRLDGSTGRYNAIVVDGTRTRVFSYEQTGGGNLGHAYYNGSVWVFETLDGNGEPNGRTAVAGGWWNSAILVDELSYVLDENRTDHSLRHAYFG